MHADGMARSLLGATHVLGDTLQEKARLVEQHLDNGTARLSGLFDSSRQVGWRTLMRLAQHHRADAPHPDRIARSEPCRARPLAGGTALTRVAQANEAFAIAGESLSDYPQPDARCEYRSQERTGPDRHSADAASFCKTESSRIRAAMSFKPSRHMAPRSTKRWRPTPCVFRKPFRNGTAGLSEKFGSFEKPLPIR